MTDERTRKGHIRVRRGNAADAEIIREALIKAACDLFLEGGLNALTMRNVAARAGVAAMTPYTYFTNKSELLWHLKNEVLIEMLEHQKGSCLNAKTARQALTSTTRAFISYCTDRPEKFQLLYIPQSLEGNELLTFNKKSEQIEMMRDFQAQLTIAFAREIGGDEKRHSTATHYRHALAIGFLHLNFLQFGPGDEFKSQLEDLVSIMVEIVELILLRQQLVEVKNMRFII